MTIKIETIENPIRRIHQANLITIGKYKDTKDINWTKVPIASLMKKEHSTIEWAPIYIYTLTRKDVTSHIVRATKQHPRFVVQSGRPDWTGKERPPYDAPTHFMVEANPLALISMARQRLCFTAMKETREWMQAVTSTLLIGSTDLSNEQAVFLKAVGEAMLPNCLYRGECYEGKKSCHRCDSQEWKEDYRKWLLAQGR